MTRCSGFSVREEMRVDEVVDDRLVLGHDGVELHAHADAAIAPRHLALGVDVLLATGHAEANADSRAGLERARRADGDAAVAEIQRERGSDGVAEAVPNRDAEDNAR